MIVVSDIVTTIMWREIQFTVTLKMTTCAIQGVETSVTVNISSFRTTPNQTITFHALMTCLLGSNHSLNYVDFIIKF